MICTSVAKVEIYRTKGANALRVRIVERDNRFDLKHMTGMFSLRPIDDLTREIWHPSNTDVSIEARIKSLNGDGSQSLRQALGPWENQSVAVCIQANPGAQLAPSQTAPPADQKTPLASDNEEPKLPERHKVETYRTLRDTKLAREIKSLYSHRCQICDYTIELPNDMPYAEAHHIQPLGLEHNGPDARENILCLCPNHHAELDYFSRPINLDDLLTIKHNIGNNYVSYHNNRHWKEKAKKG